jgi:hypothetical protein
MTLSADISVQRTSWRRQYPHFNLIALRNWVNHVEHLDFRSAGAILCLSYSNWSQILLMYLQLNFHGFFTRLENMKSFKNIRVNNRLYFMSFLMGHSVLCFLVAYINQNSLKIGKKSFCNKSCKSQ